MYDDEMASRKKNTHTRCTEADELCRLPGMTSRPKSQKLFFLPVPTWVGLWRC